MLKPRFMSVSRSFTVRCGRALRCFCLVAAGLGALIAQQPPTAALQLSNRLNHRLPKWLQISGEYRGRVEGFSGGGFRADRDDAYFLDRVRYTMLLAPTSWLKVAVQGQDARVFWKNTPSVPGKTPLVPPFEDTFALRTAYLEMGDSEKRSFGLRVGRQEINLGEQRLVGSLNWTNTARTFDAVRATLRHGKYRLDIFSAALVVPRPGQFDRIAPGNDLHGLYGAIEHLLPRATIEPYIFWRLAPAAYSPLTESKTPGHLNQKTVGVRWVGKLPANFDYGTEMVEQRGRNAGDALHAWAGHWQLGYSLAQTRFTPHLIGEYNYASGDGNPGDHVSHTFDQLFPTAHDKYGLADQVGWRNIEHLRAGVEFKPATQWTVTGNLQHYWLADPHDALYNAAGLVLIPRVAGATAGRFVGRELDAQVNYAFSKTTQVGGGFGHLFPGTFIRHTSAGHGYNFPYLQLSYLF